MSSCHHTRFNSISFQCDHRTRVGCDAQTWQEAHTGLPLGWVNRDGGHLCPEHANAELQNATIDKPHLSYCATNTVYEDGLSRPQERPAWEPYAEATLF